MFLGMEIRIGIEFSLKSFQERMCNLKSLSFLKNLKEPTYFIDYKSFSKKILCLDILLEDQFLKNQERGRENPKPFNP